MEPLLEFNCHLCLNECSENALDEISFERLREAIDFVFTFKISYTLGSNGRKVCRSCVYCIMGFYEYATQVKTNQAWIGEFEADMKDVEVDEIYSIKIEPLQMMVGSEKVMAMKTATPEELRDTGDGDVDIIEEYIGANDAARSESIGEHTTKRRKRNGQITHSCTHCSESFSQKHLLKMHMKNHLECKACGEFFSNKDLLQTHMKTMHKKDDGVMCDKCGKILKKCNLKTHIATNHTTGPGELWQCKSCSIIFCNSATLRSHTQAIHKEAGRSFTCDVCQRVYPTSRSLRGHKARVHVETKYCCAICKREFKRAVNFKEHMAAHTGVTLYDCDVCGFKFNSNANMYAHVKRRHPVEWNEKQKNRLLRRRSRVKIG